MTGTKKHTVEVILIICAAVISAGCICMPTSLPEFLANLEERSKTPGDELDPPAGSSAVCQEKLAEIISSGGYASADGEPLTAEYDLVTYSVSGDQLSSPQFGNVPASLQAYQEDIDRQAQLWDFVTAVIPSEYRQEVRSFQFFTDGVGGTLGAVQQLDNPAEWGLEMDILDANNFYDLSTTLIHEAAHLFTLDTSQVETNWEVFNAPDDPDVYERAAASCSTYFLYEGCSNPGSYLNQFFQRFWLDLYDQWVEITSATDQAALENRLHDLYGQYADQFVSDYAISSPEEDIAESFMYFVFAPAPGGDGIAEEKLLFFYEYPELVELRERMRSGLCRYAP